MTSLATEVSFASDFDVELIQFAGGDDFVVAAAKVSTKGWDSIPDSDSQGFINFLMNNRHGSPFEHGLFGWRISAPIFVWRELMRHRIASYNEESGRYKQLDGKFYVPPIQRKLKQVGKPGAYTYVAGTTDEHKRTAMRIRESCKISYTDYLYMLNDGVAKEVARMVLPVNIYSTAWVSMNPRGLMNFLSLRTQRTNAKFLSFPMWEIAQVAEKMDASFASKMPHTYRAFCEGGRVCP